MRTSFRDPDFHFSVLAGKDGEMGSAGNGSKESRCISFQMHGVSSTGNRVGLAVFFVDGAEDVLIDGLVDYFCKCIVAYG